MSEEQTMKWPLIVRVNSGAVAYASTSLVGGMMHSVFMFYYVNIFINIYHVPPAWFNISQVVYMIWNALNDPLFGYVQDNSQLSIVRSRRHTILYGAPLYVLSFLLPWFPWTREPNSWITGVHLMLSLCLYDAMFTYIFLALCCVLSEGPSSVQERIQYTQYGHIASLLGSTSVFFCSHFSQNLQNFESFQYVCVVISVLSWIAMTYTGLNARTLYDKGDARKFLESINLSSDGTTWSSVIRLTLQILCNRNFLAFVWVNFLTEFHRTGVSNTAGILTSHLIPEAELGEFTRSLIHSAVVLLPKIFIIVGRKFLSGVGYFRIMRDIFIMKIVFALVMMSVGRGHHCILTAFLVLEGVLSMVPGNLMGLPLSDIVDDDRSIHKRRHPLSSMVFGTNALITKPASSLSPMLIVYIWNSFGYQQYKQTTQENLDTNDLHSAMFHVMCLLPFIVGLMQMLIWSKYRLRHTHVTRNTYEEM